MRSEHVWIKRTNEKIVEGLRIKLAGRVGTVNRVFTFHTKERDKHEIIWDDKLDSGYVCRLDDFPDVFLNGMS